MNRERERERERENESKDWIGNQKSIYTTLGASNHTDKERQQHDIIIVPTDDTPDREERSRQEC